MLQAEVGSRGTTSVQGVDGVPLLLQLLRFPSQTVHRLGVVAPLAYAQQIQYRKHRAVSFVADCIGIIACVLDQRDLHLFGVVIDTLILILDLAQEAGDRCLQRLQPRGARPISDGFIHTAGHIQHEGDVKRDDLLLSGFTGLARHIHAQRVRPIIVLGDSLGVLWSIHAFSGSGCILRRRCGGLALVGCIFAIGRNASAGKTYCHGYSHERGDKPALAPARLGARLVGAVFAPKTSDPPHRPPIGLSTYSGNFLV